MDLGRCVVMTLCATFGAATSLAATSCGEDDRGGVQVEGGTGTETAGTVGTGTTPVTVDTTATDPAALERAMGEVAAYARGQTASLVKATRNSTRRSKPATSRAPSGPTPPDAPSTSGSSRWLRSSPSWTERSTPARTTSRGRPPTRSGPAFTRSNGCCGSTGASTGEPGSWPTDS